MSLSVLCATRAEAVVRPFLAEMGPLAKACGGRFGVVLDGSESYERWKDLGLSAHTIIAQDGVHLAMQDTVNECPTEYVLILDDDERCPQALSEWLQQRQYETADCWYISRAWLYPDRQHYITSPKHYPNFTARIGRTSGVVVPTQIHAGWIAKFPETAFCPHSLEHHKLLIRTLEERQATVQRYESIKKDAGMPGHYLPECVLVDVAEWFG